MNILTELISILKENLPEVLQLRTQKQQKEDGSYVSEGDLLYDRLVIGFIRDQFVSVQIITEETYEGGQIDITASEYIAVVDPIDGTENFVSGLREWGIGICIYRNGKFEEALIGLPELDQYIHSSDRVPRKYDSRIYGISSSLSKEDIQALETGFEYRIIGCCMYNMYNVITGSFRQFQNPKGARCWDILPGLNMGILNGLEVMVENEIYHGQFLQPDRKYRFRLRNR